MTCQSALIPSSPPTAHLLPLELLRAPNLQQGRVPEESPQLLDLTSGAQEQGLGLPETPGNRCHGLLPILASSPSTCFLYGEMTPISSSDGLFLLRSLRALMYRTTWRASDGRERVQGKQEESWEGLFTDELKMIEMPSPSTLNHEGLEPSLTSTP